MKIEHKGLGIDVELPKLTQRQVEAFFAALREMRPLEEAISAPEYAGDIVRAAARCEWLNGIGDVGDLDPRAVTFLRNEIMEHVLATQEVPPE